MDVAGTGAAGNRRRAVPYGLIALVVTFVAIGALFAFEQLPFAAPDENPHLGYAHTVARFELPEIDRSPPVPRSARQWVEERESVNAPRYLGVWVANHPPLFYVLVSPLVAAAKFMDRPDGGLLFLRLANVCFGAIGVALTYLLALEVTRGLRRIALATAAVAAFTTQAHAAFSQALNDGLGFAAGTGVVLAGIRCLHRRDSTTALFVLGGAAALAAGARASTMLLAVAVVGFVATDRFTAAGPTSRERWRAAGGVAAVGLLPATVLFGWFYVRNIMLYGDIGASRYLLDRFRRERRGSMIEMLGDVDRWLLLYRRLMSPDTLSVRHPPLMLLVGAAALVGVIAVFVTRRPGDRHATGEPASVSRRSILLLAVAIGVVAATIVQHVAGGGYTHPRYALAALGPLATLVVIGLDRLVPRVLPLALVVAMAWWTIAQIPVGVDPARVRRSRDRGSPPPEALQVLAAGPFWRALAGFGIVAGCAVTAVALVAALFERPVHRPGHDGARAAAPSGDASMSPTPEAQLGK